MNYFGDQQLFRWTRRSWGILFLGLLILRLAEAATPNVRYGAALYRYGLREEERHHPRTAKNLYQKAMNVDPLDARAFYRRGFILQTEGNDFGALALYQWSFGQDFGLVGPFYQASLILAEMKAYSRAVVLLNRALNGEPKNVSLNVLLGKVLIQSQKWDAAQDVIDRLRILKAADHADALEALMAEAFLAGHEAGQGFDKHDRLDIMAKPFLKKSKN